METKSTGPDRHRELFHQIDQARKSGETDTPLGRALVRWDAHDIVLWRDGKWRYEGFVLWFKQWKEIMSAADPTVLPDLPPHLLDPAQIAYFMGVPLGEFDWQGVPAPVSIEVEPEYTEEPPAEVGTAEAAAILGVTKDTVLKLKAAGLLEHRNAAPPGSARPVFRFTRRSVMALRMNYDRDVPVTPMPTEPSRRPGGGGRRFKHLRLEE